jgi:hypothetical protein
MNIYLFIATCIFNLSLNSLNKKYVIFLVINQKINFSDLKKFDLFYNSTINSLFKVDLISQNIN